jgi:hypothetical protein
MKIQEYLPVTEPQPDRVLIMGNILGGFLETDALGDHGYRAGVIAKETGMRVLAYTRFDEEDVAARKTGRGLARPLEADEYRGMVADHADTLQSRIEEVGDNVQANFFQASMAGGHFLDMVATERLHVDRALLVDPVSMHDFHVSPSGRIRSDFGAKVAGMSRWVGHQISSNLLHKKETRNQHPMESMGTPPINPLDELSMASNVLTTDQSYQTLCRIAEGELAADVDMQVVLCGNSFTGPKAPRAAKVAELLIKSHHNNVKLEAVVVPGMYHSITDDPYVCAEMINNAQKGELLRHPPISNFI